MHRVSVFQLEEVNYTNINELSSHSFYYGFSLYIVIETQPFVIPSGPGFSDSLVFTPTGPMTINVNGIVANDMVALEDVEMYRVRLINLNISSPYVTVGNPTNVRVISEDGKCVHIHEAT